MKKWLATNFCKTWQDSIVVQFGVGKKKGEAHKDMPQPKLQ
ncbi:hypothetical protein [Porphyromonas gingivicanis]|nr:hypothetical protein [Porphyromonas gingivicanis]